MHERHDAVISRNVRRDGGRLWRSGGQPADAVWRPRRLPPSGRLGMRGGRRRDRSRQRRDGRRAGPGGGLHGLRPVAFPVPDASASWVGVPCSALTATGGLELEGKLSSLPAGSTVLVTGAAGGTGHIAVQWAAMKGMRVAGTCGDEVKAAMLRELGCDVVVNCKLRHAVASHHKASPSPRNAPTKHRTAVYIPVDRSYGFLSAPTDSDLPCLPYSGRGRPHAGCGSGAGQRISRWLHGCV
jgi:hypothetical protein